MPDEQFRFEIAISFAGDTKRESVRRVAELLRQRIGDKKVFFDEWFEAELAGPDAQIVLQRIYGEKTRLVVACVCQRYNEKPWTQDEWRAILSFERKLRDAGEENLLRMRFLPLRFGDGKVDGLFDTAIVPDVRNRTPEAIAELILERLRLAIGDETLTVSNISTNTQPNNPPITKGVAAPKMALEPINKFAYEKLRNLVVNVLAADTTRKFIVKCNKLSETTTADELATKIFESPQPMSFLRKCVRQDDHKREIADPMTEVTTNMCRLVELISPICFIQDSDLAELDLHLKQDAHHAPVNTRDETVAKSQVAYIKRISVHLQDGNDWQTISSSVKPGRRESVSAMPHPPELGIYADGAPGREDIVDIFRDALFKAVTPHSPSLEAIQGALQDMSEYDEVFICVLFRSRLSDSNLTQLSTAFPHLVLLTAQDVDDGRHQRVLGQINAIRDEFGPKRTRAT